MRAIRWLAMLGVGAMVVVAASRDAEGQAPTPGAPGAQGQAPAAGQPPATGTEVSPDITSQIALTRAAIQVQRQAIVTMAMDLDDREAQAFWPLYRDYRLEMVKIGDRVVNLIMTYAENYPDLSDEMASKLIAEYLAIEKARTSVKSTYVPRFRKVLPARKVMRFFQIDNKLDAAISAELAEEIPLAR